MYITLVCSASVKYMNIQEMYIFFGHVFTSTQVKMLKLMQGVCGDKQKYWLATP